MMNHDPVKLERELRSLLEQQLSLGEALRTLHSDRGFGLLLLVPAVVNVVGMEKSEAQRLVIREASNQLPS